MMKIQMTVILLAAGLISQCSAQEAADSKTEKAPDKFQVQFETSCGNFVVEVNRAWAPHGADRFHELVKAGYYDECRFFRVVPGFVVQWGMSGDPAVYRKWKDAVIPDDPVVQSNERGMLTFASRGPDTRTCQLFINYKDNSRLDGLGFAPFAKVIEGMDVVDKINSAYGEDPRQPQIEAEGNRYLKELYPDLDYIKKATVVTPAEKDEAAKK